MVISYKDFKDILYFTFQNTLFLNILENSLLHNKPENILPLNKPEKNLSS